MTRYTMPDGKDYEFASDEEATRAMIAWNKQFGAAQEQPQEENALMKYIKRPTSELGGAILRSANELAGAVVEPALALGTGTVGKIASDVTGLAAIPLHAAGVIETDPAQVKARTQEYLQYRPKTELGKMTTAPFEAVGQAVGEGVKAVASPIENPYLRAGAEEAVSQAIGILPAAKATKLQTRGAKLEQLNKTRTQIREAGQREGLIAPPETGGMKNFMYKTAKGSEGVSLKNKETITNMVADEIGAERFSPITPEVIGLRKAELNKAYDSVENSLSGGVKTTTSFDNKMKMLHSDLARKQEANPKTFNDADLLAVVKEHLPKNGQAKVIPAGDIMDIISELREKARLTENKRSAAKYKVIANAYEKIIEENLRSAGKLNAYRDFELAREQLAKINFVENIVDQSGYVNPQKLASYSGKSLKDAKYLTGKLKVAADFARQYESATKNISPDKMSSLGKWEVVVPMVAGLGSLGGTAGMMAGGSTTAGLLTGLATGLPAAATITASKMGQRGMLQSAPSYTYPKAIGVAGTAYGAPKIYEEEK